jgi:hypothetical protein
VLPQNLAGDGDSGLTLLGELEACRKRVPGDVDGEGFGLPFNVRLSMRKYWGSITSGLDAAATSASSEECAGHVW